MLKRLFDIFVAFFGLLILSPLLLVCLFLIWKQDHHSPFYVASRVGRNGKPFRMVKLRSMIIGADKSGVDSTAADDQRITAIGNFVRSYKVDEVSQLWNVLKGDMSLVGPRPNVEADVALYTDQERRLLDVRPGITDLSSIVFSDEGEILRGSDDPDLRYNQVIRPWKSRLGLLYIAKRSFGSEFLILVFTAAAIIKKQTALNCVQWLLKRWECSQQLLEVCRRQGELPEYPPPGSDDVVRAR